MPRIKCLPDYVAVLRENNDLVEVQEEVDWNLEIGAITKRAGELGAPAALFTNIKDNPLGVRILGGPASASARPGQRLARTALSLGLDPAATAREIVDALATARRRPFQQPNVVGDAPFRKNVKRGAMVDLTQLPIPKLHMDDGRGNRAHPEGRMINTYGTWVVRTPDGKWTNWSISTAQLIDARTMATVVIPDQHLGVIRQMWQQRGEKMPFALAVGCEPFVPIVSGMPLARNVSEVEYMGAYFGEPIDVVRCESDDRLCVPASAQIVLEGWAEIVDDPEDPTKMAPAGPMPDYVGIVPPVPPAGPKPQPLFHVESMSYCDNPILPIVAAGAPPEENHTVWLMAVAAEMLGLLRDAGLPVTSVWSPFESVGHWMVITVPDNWKDGFVRPPTVASPPTNQELLRALASVLANTHPAWYIPKFLVTTDTIVPDPADIAQVVWAFATHNRPGPEGMHLHTPTAGAWPLVFYLEAADKYPGGAQMAFYDCLVPDEWSGNELPRGASFATQYAVELDGQDETVHDRVIRRWTDYGFPPVPS